MMSFTVEDGRLLDGTPFRHVIDEVQSCNPLALLVNCRPGDQIAAALQTLRDAYPGIIGAYGNGPGCPDPVSGWQLEEGGVGTYLNDARTWYGLGARIIGGCCGTTPEHIAALSSWRNEIQ